MRNVVITSAARTAIGKFGGSLRDVPATEMGTVVVKEALKRSAVDAQDVQELQGGARVEAGAHEHQRQVQFGGQSFFVEARALVGVVCLDG